MKNLTERTIEEHRINIQEFANKHKIIFDDEGECGFGRECVGLTNGNNWVDYNPTSYPDISYVEGFFDERFFDITPENAYHKHNCIAVLGRGDSAIIELSEWIDKLNEIGVTVEKYKTGATGIQAMISGLFGTAIKPI